MQTAVPVEQYEIGAKEAFVSVAGDHDTPVFAVSSIEAWWSQVGEKCCPDAREIFITVDAGGHSSLGPLAPLLSSYLATSFASPIRDFVAFEIGDYPSLSVHGEGTKGTPLDRCDGGHLGCDLYV